MGHRIRNMSKSCLYLTFSLVLCFFVANSSANPKPNPTDIEIFINRLIKQHEATPVIKGRRSGLIGGAKKTGQSKLMKAARYFPLHYSRDANGNWKKPPASDYKYQGEATNMMEEEGGEYYYPGDGEYYEY